MNKPVTTQAQHTLWMLLLTSTGLTTNIVIIQMSANNPNHTHNLIGEFLVCDHGSLLGLCVQDYKFLCAAVTICTTLVNIQTDTDTQRERAF